MMLWRGLPVGGEIELVHVERFALQPDLELGRGQQRVEAHRQVEAIFGREEGVHLERAQLLDRRRGDLVDQLLQVEVFALAPGVLEDVGEQDALAAAHRVGVDAGQPQQRRHRAADAFQDRLGLRRPVELGRGQAAHDVERRAHLRAGRKDRVLCALGKQTASDRRRCPSRPDRCATSRRWKSQIPRRFCPCGGRRRR